MFSSSVSLELSCWWWSASPANIGTPCNAVELKRVGIDLSSRSVVNSKNVHALGWVLVQSETLGIPGPENIIAVCEG